MKALISVIVTLSLYLLSCAEKTAELDEVDRQIEQKNYAQAKQLVLVKQQKSFSDTLQYARIKARLQRLEHLIYFQKLENLIFRKNWTEAETLSIRMQIGLTDSTFKSDPEYYFSLFHWRAVIDSALNRPDSSQVYLQKAIQLPTTQRYFLQDDLEKLGLILAKQDSLVTARRLFDQSLRMTRVSQLDTVLQNIYYLYMDGKFNECLKQFREIPDSLKSKRWKNLHLFLEKYGDQLTLDERFKLW